MFHNYESGDHVAQTFSGLHIGRFSIGFEFRLFFGAEDQSLLMQAVKERFIQRSNYG